MSGSLVEKILDSAFIDKTETANPTNIAKLLAVWGGLGAAGGALSGLVSHMSNQQAIKKYGEDKNKEVEDLEKEAGVETIWHDIKTSVPGIKEVTDSKTIPLLLSIAALSGSGIFINKKIKDLSKDKIRSRSKRRLEEAQEELNQAMSDRVSGLGYDADIDIGMDKSAARFRLGSVSDFVTGARKNKISNFSKVINDDSILSSLRNVSDDLIQSRSGNQGFSLTDTAMSNDIKNTIHGLIDDAALTRSVDLPNVKGIDDLVNNVVKDSVNSIDSRTLSGWNQLTSTDPRVVSDRIRNIDVFNTELGNLQSNIANRNTSNRLFNIGSDIKKRTDRSLASTLASSDFSSSLRGRAEAIREGFGDLNIPDSSMNARVKSKLKIEAIRDLGDSINSHQTTVGGTIFSSDDIDYLMSRKNKTPGGSKVRFVDQVSNMIDNIDLQRTSTPSNKGAIKDVHAANLRTSYGEAFAPSTTAKIGDHLWRHKGKYSAGGLVAAPYTATLSESIAKARYGDADEDSSVSRKVGKSISDFVRGTELTDDIASVISDIPANVIIPNKKESQEKIFEVLNMGYKDASRDIASYTSKGARDDRADEFYDALTKKFTVNGKLNKASRDSEWNKIQDAVERRLDSSAINNDYVKLLALLSVGGLITGASTGRAISKGTDKKIKKQYREQDKISVRENQVMPKMKLSAKKK